MIKVLLSRKIMLFQPILLHAGHINGIKIHKHLHSLNSGAVCGYNLNANDELPGFCVGTLCKHDARGDALDTREIL